MFNFYFLIAAILFVVIDSIYLNLIKSYFMNQIQKVQGSPIKINFPAVLLCYSFLVIGLNYFIIKPKRSPGDAFLFGVVVYGVYETTNLALLKNWSWLTVFMDTLWGGILFGIVTWIVNLIRGK
jgi:uncharacterized membrane protein